MAHPIGNVEDWSYCTFAHIISIINGIKYKNVEKIKLGTEIRFILNFE